MKQHRSAQGKIVDMAALAARNERVRAVGNMKVNARGDTIDASGKVIVPVTQKVGEQYQKTVGNRSAQPRRPPPTREVSRVPQKAREELTQDEIELNESLSDELEVEQIRAKENKK